MNESSEREYESTYELRCPADGCLVLCCSGFKSGKVQGKCRKCKSIVTLIVSKGNT